MEPITLKTVSPNTEDQRNVTIYNGRDGIRLLGMIEHGTRLIINQELVDQLQELVNERKTKPETVPSKKLREAVKALVNTDSRELWRQFANEPDSINIIKNFSGRQLDNFWNKNRKLLDSYLDPETKNTRFYANGDSAICKAIKAVAFYLTDGGKN